MQQHLALHVKGSEVAALEIGKDKFAISHRRGIATRPVAVLPLAPLAQGGVPDLFPLPVVGEDPVLLTLGRGQDDEIVPHDGRGAPAPGQVGLPEKMVIVELGGVAPLGRRPGIRRPTPRRPLKAQRPRE